MWRNIEVSDSALRTRYLESAKVARVMKSIDACIVTQAFPLGPGPDRWGLCSILRFCRWQAMISGQGDISVTRIRVSSAECRWKRHIKSGVRYCKHFTNQTAFITIAYFLACRIISTLCSGTIQFRTPDVAGKYRVLDSRRPRLNPEFYAFVLCNRANPPDLMTCLISIYSTVKTPR
jgi:hypothetical protein